jgi:hypothetical protein
MIQKEVGTVLLFFPNEWQPPHPTLPRVFIITLHYRSRDSAVDIAFRLRTGRSGVSIPAGSRSFYHPQNVQTSCGTHPAFCSIAIRVLSPGGSCPTHTSSPPVCHRGLMRDNFIFCPQYWTFASTDTRLVVTRKTVEGKIWFEDLCLSGCRCATSTEMCSLLANCWTGGNQRVIRDIIS